MQLNQGEDQPGTPHRCSFTLCRATIWFLNQLAAAVNMATLNMMPVPDWESFLYGVGKDLRQQISKYNMADDEAVRMIGVLFARPESSLTKQQIIPHLEYFHIRSGEFITFFCPGYWNIQTGEKNEKEIGTIEGKSWFFSNDRFDEFRREFESRSKWHYSGGADLILTNARWLRSDYLDLSSAVCANLDEMAKDKSIDSVSSLFEKIFRYAEKPSQIDPTWGFSDQRGVEVAGSAFTKLILAFLPKKVGDDVMRAAHYAVKDISKSSA